MPKLSGKQWLYVGAGALVLILVYRWYQNQQASSAATTDTLGTTTDPSSSDYGQLSGQEQGDVAALSGQEASDVGNLQSGLAAATGQETADVSGLTGAISALSGQEGSDVSGLQAEIAGIPAGATGATGAPGKGLTKAQANALKSIPALNKRISNLTHELSKVMAGEKKSAGQGHKNVTHPKGGTSKTKTASSPHTNAGQRNGTASHSVATRSHAKKTKARR